MIDVVARFIACTRIGDNGRHDLAGLLRRPIFPRLAGQEDVDDADRLRRDPVKRRRVGADAWRRVGERHGPLRDRASRGTGRGAEAAFRRRFELREGRRFVRRISIRAASKHRLERKQRLGGDPLTVLGEFLN